MYISLDGGDTWKNVKIESDGLSTTQCSFTNEGERIALYVGSMNGVYKSIDYGKTWKNLGPDRSILLVFTHSSMVLVGQHGGGGYRSTEGGKEWKTVGNHRFYSSIQHKKMIFSGDFDGLSKSEDDGETWAKVAIKAERVYWVAKNDLKLFASSSEPKALFTSEDDDATWQEYTDDYPYKGNVIETFLTYRNIVLIGLEQSKVIISYNFGKDWEDYGCVPPFLQKYYCIVNNLIFYKLRNFFNGTCIV